MVQYYMKSPKFYLYERSSGKLWLYDFNLYQSLKRKRHYDLHGFRWLFYCLLFVRFLLIFFVQEGWRESGIESLLGRDPSLSLQQFSCICMRKPKWTEQSHKCIYLWCIFFLKMDTNLFDHIIFPLQKNPNVKRP